MLKKIVAGIFAFVIIASIALFFWVRAVFTQEHVRATLAEQLSKTLGQPVAIGTIDAAIYPRVTVNLGDVSIGRPPRITVATLHVGTDVRALLSRRIEHAALRLDGARIALPLPEFTIASTPGQGERSGRFPVEIVSIDEIALRDVQITSGGRTLHGDIEIVPHGQRVEIRKLTLAADTAKVDITGDISDISGPIGELAVKSSGLNFDQLLAFISDFVASSGFATRSGRSNTPASPMNLVLSITADRATIGLLSLDALNGLARLTQESLTLEPISFGVFGGNYHGVLALTLGEIPRFRLSADLSGIDMAQAMTFAGHPDLITGRLAGNVNLTGRGLSADSVARTARGRGRVDITNGTVKRLGLVRTVVVATSGRGNAGAQPGSATPDESFARLGATLTVADGAAVTQDLRFESNDVLLDAAGVIRLDGSAINLTGQVQLSDKLSKEAGRDLVRYTQQNGRVTLPATITGSADNFHVRIDMAGVAKRAIVNRASEEIQKALKEGLGRIFGK